ncbi:PREDICTED: uncharacterized protein LOC109114786 [Nelumbo nucifera]|uniref:Uncharacterized protein LOC109114786 n=1 Tax=Nelumbo nucifera TaxID=4432 RepID=A0A1U8Q654_NELNU|nr:PREDICTED: uncharacterized protein LOC109114786 [Nelumbo nucifera]
MLIVYVDDIVVTGDDITVARLKKGIFLSQRKYVLDLLYEVGKFGCKPAETPIDLNHKLSSTKGEVLPDRGIYQRLVGRLLYLCLTRLDISYAVGVVSQYIHEPRTSHMQAVNKILAYLKGCPGKGMLYSNHGHLKIEAYTDVDWAGSIDDKRSTSGYYALVGGNLISWKSKKQSVVVRSSAEAKYRAMSHEVSELLWSKTLLTEMGIQADIP